MKVLLQRVSEASVGLDGETIAEIGLGMVVLVCTEKDDGEGDADFFARKIANMRLFADEDGKSNLSLLDVGGEALVISQFTLAAEGVPVKTGKFRSHMAVSLTNDGPMTIWMDSGEK